MYEEAFIHKNDFEKFKNVDCEMFSRNKNSPKSVNFVITFFFPRVPSSALSKTVGKTLDFSDLLVLVYSTLYKSRKRVTRDERVCGGVACDNIFSR